MGVQQILETTNGDETTITVITDNGNVATRTYDSSSVCNSYGYPSDRREDAMTSATEEALKKDR